MVDISDGIWVPHRAAVLEVWADQAPIGIYLDGLWDRFWVSFNKSKFAVCLIYYFVDVWIPGEVV